MPELVFKTQESVILDMLIGVSHTEMSILTLKNVALYYGEK